MCLAREPEVWQRVPMAQNGAVYSCTCADPRKMGDRLLRVGPEGEADVADLRLGPAEPH